MRVAWQLPEQKWLRIEGIEVDAHGGTISVKAYSWVKREGSAWWATYSTSPYREKL
jgi:hypothetical protein